VIFTDSKKGILMEYYRELLIVLLPWLIFILFAFLASILIKLAKKRRGVAVAFGVMAQMLLPDPQVEKTIETMIVTERRDIRKEEESDKKN